MYKSFFRVANLNHVEGLWYNRNGEFTGRIHKEFSFCKNHDLPMPYDESILGWLFCYEYRSLHGNFWWRKNFDSFRYCLGTREQVEREFNRLTDHGRPVKASPNG